MLFLRTIFILGIILVIGFMLWLLIDVVLRNPRQLYSLFGFCVILLICIWGSKFPQHVSFCFVSSKLWYMDLNFGI